MMNRKLDNLSTPAMISRLREVIPASAGAFLVGGVIRDQVSGFECHDVDVIVQYDTRKIARQTADYLGGKFFPLDETRGMYRVLVTNENQSMDMVDISRLQADSLEADLRLRDFTVNAVAASLHQPETIIDPLNGLVDLRQGVLRLCADDSLENDPVRVIRAARMALAYQLRLSPGMLGKIRNTAQKLVITSAERKRDELFKILDGNFPGTSIRLLETFGVLPFLLPNVAQLKGEKQSMPHTMDVFEHTLAIVNHLKGLRDLFINPRNSLDDGGNLTIGLAAGKLGIFSEKIQTHYHNYKNPFRSRISLNLFGALLHDVGKPTTKTIEVNGRIRFLNHEIVGKEMAMEICHAMALSEIETEAIGKMVAHHMRIRNVIKETETPSRRSIYRFYKDTGDVGIDICMLSLSDFLAKSEHPPKLDEWIKMLNGTGDFLNGWFSQKETLINPVKLLSGEQVMNSFHLESGPLVGKLLAAIEEAQAAGEVNSRKDAFDFAKEMVEKWEKC